MIILFIYCADVENCESIRDFDLERDRVSLFVQFGLKKRICLKKMMSLSLSWTCQRDRVSLIVKFGLDKNNFV